jgi:hypothetical protein
MERSNHMNCSRKGAHRHEVIDNHVHHWSFARVIMPLSARPDHVTIFLLSMCVSWLSIFAHGIFCTFILQRHHPPPTINLNFFLLGAWLYSALSTYELNLERPESVPNILFNEWTSQLSRRAKARIRLCQDYSMCHNMNICRKNTIKSFNK